MCLRCWAWFRSRSWLLMSRASTRLKARSQSVDHEVRQDGVRVILVEPAYTSTEFDTKAIVADGAQPVYAERRATFDGVMAEAMAQGDDILGGGGSRRRGSDRDPPQTPLHRRSAGRPGQRLAPLGSGARVRWADPQAQQDGRLSRKDANTAAEKE